MTIEESIAQIRAGLGHPLPAAPDRREILQAIQDVSQLLHIEMQNTGVAWASGRVDIVVGPGTGGEFLIPRDPADFSKDVWLITKDETDPNFSFREVPRSDLQDLDRFYQGPRQAYSAGHTAEVFTVFRANEGLPYLKILPEPYDSRTYELWYETGVPAMTNLGDSPTLPQFHLYRNLLVREQLLPKCSWYENDARDMEKMKALAMALQAILPRYRRAWDNFISSDRQAGICERIGYGESPGQQAWQYNRFYR